MIISLGGMFEVVVELLSIVVVGSDEEVVLDVVGSDDEAIVVETDGF